MRASLSRASSIKTTVIDEEKFSKIIGINIHNQLKEERYRRLDFYVYSIITNCSLRIFEKTGVYIEFVIYRSRVLSNNKESSCPDFGSLSYNLEATRPSSVDLKKWQESLLYVINLLKEEFNMGEILLTVNDSCIL